MSARFRFAPVLATLVAACATSRGADANQSRFERAVGTATALDAYERSMKVIRQHQFQIERESRETGLYLETRWRSRVPFPDETALGINAAQVRVFVRGTPRSSTSQGELFSVSIAIENRVQVAGSTDWTEATATRQYQDYARAIAEDLRRELEIGVRRYGDPATGS